MKYDLVESGLRIKRLRKQKKLTQEQLAEKINMSISTLGKLETGYAGVSIHILIDIAIFFDISLDFIILGRNCSRMP